MSEQYLIHGAFLKCSGGTIPSQIMVSSHSSIFVQSLQIATEDDKQPMVNIQTFGVCSFTQKPCIPSPIIWQDQHTEVEICGKNSLTVKSCINCTLGGKIEPVISGQTPTPGFSIMNNNGNAGTATPLLGFVVAVPAIAEVAVAAEATAVVVETSLAAEVAMGTFATAGVLLADDVTGVGVVDDVAIPFVVVGGLLAAGAIALWALWDEPAPAPAPVLPIPVTIPAPAYPPGGIVETEPDPITIPVPIAIPKTDAIPKDDTDEDDDCLPKPLGFHRGGNTIHNFLADTKPPNRLFGSDFVVKGKAFDAYSTSGVLWEIKTDNYSSYNDFVKRIHLSKLIAETEYEYSIATSCGLPYILGVLDSEEQIAVQTVLPLVNVRLLTYP